jgi:hypothetical protein
LYFFSHQPYNQFKEVLIYFIFQNFLLIQRPE